MRPTVIHGADLGVALRALRTEFHIPTDFPAVLLQKRLGEVFSGVVVEAQEDRGEVQLTDPPVRARLDGERLPLGQQVHVRLTTAEVAKRRTEFVLA